MMMMMMTTSRSIHRRSEWRRKTTDKDEDGQDGTGFADS
jgi:hypothetical protein